MSSEFKNPGSLDHRLQMEVTIPLSQAYYGDMVCIKVVPKDETPIRILTFSRKVDHRDKWQNPARRLVLCAKIMADQKLYVAFHGKLLDPHQIIPDDPIHTWEPFNFQRLLEEASEHIDPVPTN